MEQRRVGVGTEEGWSGYRWGVGRVEVKRGRVRFQKYNNHGNMLQHLRDASLEGSCYAGKERPHNITSDLSKTLFIILTTPTPPP